ncbi:zinc finger, PHD-type containing protein [Tanacetum coccineum]
MHVLHVSSRYQYADIFTKALPLALFEEFFTGLSVRSHPAQTACVVAMESLQHFSHDHLLSLIHLQTNKNNVNSDDEEDEKAEKVDDDFVVEDQHIGQCNMCKEEIYSFHLCLQKTKKKFIDADHPYLIKLPFPDESCSLIKHHFSNHEESFINRSSEKMLNHTSHPHQLVWMTSMVEHSSLRENSVSLHDPMKRSELLCDGCVKPVTTLPFYKCSQSCDFVLHEWCVIRLPSEIQNHPFHPKHTLVLLPKYHWTLVNCRLCSLPSNGFMYECAQCNFCIDINCAFIPEKITHEAHPNHLLSRIDASVADRACKACRYSFGNRMGFCWVFTSI